MTRQISLALVAAGILYAQSASAATCESLASMTLANGHVTSAAMVAPGAFTPAGGGGPSAAPSVAATLSFRRACRPSAA